MATLAKLAIYLGLDSSGLSKGVTTATKQVSKFREAITSSIGGGLFAAGAAGAATVAVFLTMEKIISRIKKALSEQRVNQLASPANAAAVRALSKAWEWVNEQIDSAIIKLTARFAPVLLTLGDNTLALLDGWIDIDGAINSVASAVEFVLSKLANVQGVVSGLALSIATSWIEAFLKIERAYFEMLQSFGDTSVAPQIARVTAELRANAELLDEAKKLFNAGISGERGRDFLAQVEARQKAFQNEQRKPAGSAMRQDLRPAPLLQNTKEAISAINERFRQSLRLNNPQKEVVNKLGVLHSDLQLIAGLTRANAPQLLQAANV